MRIAPPVVLDASQQETLKQWAGSRSLPARQVERARVVLLAAAGAGGFLLWGGSGMVIENQLVEPIQITIAGAAPQTVDPGAQVRVKTSDQVPWALIRPTTPEGVALGTQMGGTLPAGTKHQIIGGTTSQPPTFSPRITNATDRSLTITVNAGLAGAMPCPCLVGPGKTDVRIGYYLLFENSTVRAEDQSGKSATFSNLGQKVDPTSGAVGLRFEDKDFR